MRAVILAPWRGGDDFRERAWRLVQAFYESSGYELFVGDSDPALSFNISEANNLLAEEAGDWDVALFIGADCIIPMENVHRGIAYAHEHQVITLPHDEFMSLERQGLKRIGYVLPFGNEKKWRAWSKKVGNVDGKLYAPSGVLAMPRSVWDRIGGYDERFTGWGYEDAALLVAAGEFHRLSGPMYHYWHPSRRYVIAPDSETLWTKHYRPNPPRQFLVDEDRWLGGEKMTGTWGGSWG